MIVRDGLRGVSLHRSSNVAGSARSLAGPAPFELQPHRERTPAAVRLRPLRRASGVLGASAYGGGGRSVRPSTSGASHTPPGLHYTTRAAAIGADGRASATGLPPWWGNSLTLCVTKDRRPRKRQWLTLLEWAIVLSLVRPSGVQSPGWRRPREALLSPQNCWHGSPRRQLNQPPSQLDRRCFRSCSPCSPPSRRAGAVPGTTRATGRPGRARLPFQHGAPTSIDEPTGERRRGRRERPAWHPIAFHSSDDSGCSTTPRIGAPDPRPIAPARARRSALRHWPCNGPMTGTADALRLDNHPTRLRRCARS